MRSIYARCRAEVMVSRTDERGREKTRTSDSRGPRHARSMRISRFGEASQLTTLLALQRFLPFKADDWNRNQRGGGVYPADMKHRIEDQTGKGYAGKVGT